MACSSGLDSSPPAAITRSVSSFDFENSSLSVGRFDISLVSILLFPVKAFCVYVVPSLSEQELRPFVYDFNVIVIVLVRS